MTTIVYHDDVLMGDSRRIEIVGDHYSFSKKQKVFLHDSNVFAFGVCGNNLPYDNALFESHIKETVKSVLTTGSSTESFPYEGIYILIMTKKHTFTIYKESPDTKLERQIFYHNNDASISYGTGEKIVIPMLLSGVSIEEVMHETTVLDPFTGGDIYGVRRSILIDPPSDDNW